MTATSKTIIFFGTEDFSLISLRALVEAGFSVGAVVTKPDTLRGRGNKLTKPAVKEYAEQHNIPVLQPHKLSDIIPDIQAFDSPVGVLVSFGKIIPQSIIDLFTPGIINVHPSLLPLYRGPSPIESAIANRDGKTGVSIMQLTREMDAGPVYRQVLYALDQTETGPELSNTLGMLGANILVDTLPNIIDGSLKPEPQRDKDATYCNLLSRKMSHIDPSTMTPGQAEAHIRAYLAYPRSRITIGGRATIVTKAHVVMNSTSPLSIEFSNGAFLAIDELVAPSGKTITAEAYLRGYSSN